MIKSAIKYTMMIFLIIVLIVLAINYYVVFSVKNQIVIDDYSNLNDIDCVVVLGAGIWGDRPSPMLEDRLDTAVDLYQKGIVSKIIMSGDHGRNNYDEVNVMKQYAIDQGVPSSDIFMDHAGFSTYDSIYRAKEIFNADKAIIVTQEYHLYRALYIANKLGLEAYGVRANPKQYYGQLFRELREILARNKDFIKSIYKPKPTYLGEVIPVSGDGNITND